MIWIRALAAAVTMLVLMGCGSGGGDDAVSVGGRAVKPFSFNPLYPQQWSLHADQNFYMKVWDKLGILGDPDAHIHPWPTLEYTGRGIKVGVIDDGLDVTHEDLAGGIVATYNVKMGDSDVMPHVDTANHGTEVTGNL
jgi:subtilisin family serine protease